MSKCLAWLMKRYSFPRVPRGRLWIKKPKLRKLPLGFGKN